MARAGIVVCTSSAPPVSTELLKKSLRFYSSITIHRFFFFAKVAGIQPKENNTFTEICNSFTDYGSAQIKVTTETCIFAVQS